MAKLDASGRPIYETAEEYNQAHNTGSTHGTYDSPEGENYKHTTYKENRRNERAAARQMKNSTPKNTKKVILICGIVLVFVNMAVILIMFNAFRGTMGGIYEDIDESRMDLDDDEDYEDYGEYIGENDVPLPEGFDKFTYDGVTYSIPMSYQELSQMGFTLEEAYDEDYLVPSYSDELVILNGDDGYMAGMVRFINDSDEELPLSQCVVDYFYLENDGVYDEGMPAPDFVFGNGFTMESTYEELEAYFGVPYYQYIDDDEDYGCYESYEWVYDNGEEYHCFMVTFFDGIIADVSIEKYTY